LPRSLQLPPDEQCPNSSSNEKYKNTVGTAFHQTGYIPTGVEQDGLQKCRLVLVLGEQQYEKNSSWCSRSGSVKEKTLTAANAHPIVDIFPSPLLVTGAAGHHNGHEVRGRGWPRMEWKEARRGDG
jgi:hypothetical protein